MSALSGKLVQGQADLPARALEILERIGAVAEVYIAEVYQALEVLQIVEVTLIRLTLVSTHNGLDADSALAGNYLMVDWGLAHALQHRRLYPDAPEPRIRVGQAKMALAYMLELGGSAYLPERMVAQELEARTVHRVPGAPDIERHAYVVYPLRSAREGLIRETLQLFGRDPAQSTTSREM